MRMKSLDKLDERGGLPAWTYFNEELNEIEKEQLFRRHWQLACHVSNLPKPGNFITFDMVGERAIIMRGKDGQVRAFHNLCRHRGSRVLAEERGHCPLVMTCPFHGWSYNLDGTLRRPFLPETLPELDPVEHGLKPIEMEIWMGFVFLRFEKGDQPAIKDLLKRHEAEVAPYDAENILPESDDIWSQELDVNWKAVRDVDNEGYHVPMAHPSLQDLYGETYYDEGYKNGTSRSYGSFEDLGDKAKHWSVRAYKRILPDQSHLPEQQRRAWLYIGLFPNCVMMFYPDSVGFYQEFPLSARKTIQRGRRYRYQHEDRALRLSRYLSARIDGVTGDEDTQLIYWSCEAMESTAFDGYILSDTEVGVRSHHDALRAAIPVMDREQEPGPNQVAAVNAQLSGARSEAAE